MLALVDVDYRVSEAVAACALIEGWEAAEPALERVHRVSPAAAYEPGAFYKRELPALLAGLAEVNPAMLNKE